MDQFMLMDDSPANSYRETAIVEVALHLRQNTDAAMPHLLRKALEREVLYSAYFPRS